MDEKNKIEIYKTKDGQIQLDVFVDEETVWLTQANMVQLFQTSKQNVSLHINNIFKEGELEKKGVVKDYLTTASDGKTYKVKYFNLDVIISVVRCLFFADWGCDEKVCKILRHFRVSSVMYI